MPKELLCVGPERFEWGQYDEPALSGGQVRVRSEFGAAKHGTEIAIFKGYQKPRGRLDPVTKTFTHEEDTGPFRPFPVGNMTVGPVVEVGPEVAGVAEGDRVLFYGGFRPTHVAEAARCWKVPADLPWQSAVCLDPADFAMGAVRDGHVRVGDAVAFLGLGAIGLMGVQIAKAAGAYPVIASDPLPARRAAAVKVGADLALDPAACDVGLEIKKATANRGADVVIEYSGNVHAMQAALRGVAYGGTVVAGAYPPPYPAGLNFGAEAHVNIPQIVFSRSCSEPGRDHPRWTDQRVFEVCLRMLIDGTLRGQEVVAPVVPFADAAEHYPKIVTEPDAYIKLGITY